MLTIEQKKVLDDAIFFNQHFAQKLDAAQIYAQNLSFFQSLEFLEEMQLQEKKQKFNIYSFCASPKKAERIQYTGVYHDSIGKLVATDGYTMVVIDNPTSPDEDKFNGQIVDKIGNVIKANPVHWRSVIPVQLIEVSHLLQIESLKEFCAAAKIAKKNGETKFYHINNPEYGYREDVINKYLQFVQKFTDARTFVSTYRNSPVLYSEATGAQFIGMSNKVQY